MTSFVIGGGSRAFGSGGSRGGFNSTSSTRPIRHIGTGTYVGEYEMATLFHRPQATKVSIQPYEFDGMVPSKHGAPALNGTSPKFGNSAIAAADFNGDGRSEVVAAAHCSSSADVCLALRDTSGVYSTWMDTGLATASSGPGRIRLAAGDVDGDGTPELVLALVGAGQVVRLRTYEVDLASSPPFTTKATGKGPAADDARGSFDVVTADLDHDGKAEIVVAAAATPYANAQPMATVFGAAGGTFVSRLTFGYGFSFAHPSFVSLAKGTFFTSASSSTGTDLAIGSVTASEDDIDTYDFAKDGNGALVLNAHKDRSLASGSGQNGYVRLATADYDRNGRDEIVAVTTGSQQGSSESPVYVLLMTTQDDGTPVPATLGQPTSVGDTWGPDGSGQASLAVGNVLSLEPTAPPEATSPQILVTSEAAGSGQNADAVDLTVLKVTPIGSGEFQIQQATQTALPGNIRTDGDTYSPRRSEVDQTGFALPDLDGDSVRLGTPKKYQADGVVQPLVILRAPPIQFDVLGGKSYDVDACYNPDQQYYPCNFVSTYSVSQSSTADVSLTVKDDWGISVNAEAKAPLGALDVSMQGRYGQGFENSSENAKTSTVKVTIPAKRDDRIYSLVSNEVVLEYPVYTRGGTTPSAYVAVMTPTSWTDRVDSGRDADVQQWERAHEVGNLFSYFSDPNGNTDRASDAVSPDTWPQFTIDSDSGGTGEADFSDLQKSHFQTSWSAGATLGIKGGFDAFGAEVEVGVEGKYDHSSIQNTDVSIENGTMVDFQVGAASGKLIGASNYFLEKPYLYWAKSGALVLDWAVQVPSKTQGGTESWWHKNYGHVPNPAFDLPFLLDEAKGFAQNDPAEAQSTPDIVLSSLFPRAGHAVTIEARVHNYSMKPMDSVDVQFYKGKPGGAGVAIGSAVPVQCTSNQSPCLPAEATGTASLTWTIPAGLAGKDVRIYGVIDPQNAVQEVHENDNMGWTAVHVTG